MDGVPFSIPFDQQIRAFVESRFPLVAAANLGDDDSLFESGAIDSLGLLDVVGFLEDELGLEIDDDDMEPENFETIAEMIRFAESKRA
ncbi:MAG: acyl carrier protein [Hyphomicrobiaceae bacterium]